MAANKGSKDLKITRVYDAPVKAVWDAWTDPEQTVKWWGPRDHFIKHIDKDLRPGGFWKYTMYGPNGQTWDNYTVYLEVEEFKKLVYDHGGGENRPPLFRVTVLFNEVRGKTKMEMTMSLPTPEAAAEIAKFVKQAGGNSTWDRLGEHLEKEQTGKEAFIINRTFETPIETLFDMWVKPENVSQWLPPTGMQMQYLRREIREGSTTFYRMFNDQMELYGQTEYLKIQRPDELVFVQRFCDKDEKPGKHPMVPTWPANMETVVKFVAESPTSTRVTVTWQPTGPVSQEELKTFIDMRASMTQGWTGSFEKLDTLLGTEGW